MIKTITQQTRARKEFNALGRAEKAEITDSELITEMTKDMKNTVPLIAFGLTDEIFSVASLKTKDLSKEYMITLESCAYFALAIGTAMGFILGGILPASVQLSMGIALYALFVAILVPEMKKSVKVVVLLVLSGMTNTICLYLFNIPQGWSIIIAIILVSVLGLFIKIDERELCNE